MNKRDLKRATAVALSVMLSVAYVPDATRAETKNVAVKAAKKSKKSKKSKKPVGFKISRTSGTYDKKVTVKVRAKKKYKVYYTTKRKFKKKMVIKPGKLKTFKFDKTTTLRLFAVKKSKKMTTKKLNKKAKRAKTSYVYKYVIKKDFSKNEDKKPTDEKSDGGKEESKNEDPKKEENVNDKDITANSPYDETDLVIPEMIKEDNEKADEDACKIEATTPVVTFAEGEFSVNVNGENAEAPGLNISENKDVKRILIREDGTYAFSGKTANTIMYVADNVKANLIFADFSIDDTKLAEVAKADNSVLSFGKGSEVNITLVGENEVKGSETFADASKIAAVISQNSDENVVSTLKFVNGGNGSLAVSESLSDGIATKGELVIKSGNISVTSDGDCLKGTGFDGKGGVKIAGGNIELSSLKGAAIKSKNGTVDVSGGVINVTFAGDDVINAKNYSANISGGYINADNVYGDGIQANDVNISDGNIVIKTYFENAGLNYYNKDLGEGNYNTNIKHDNFSSSSKEEYINVDLGSHKGIKAGSKDYYYTYNAVKEGSKKEAGVEYHDEATGSLNISGGNIFLDTTNTGIKYTAGGPGMMPPQGFDPGEGMMPPPPNMNVDDGNLTTAGEGQLMLGCPEDGIKSQTSFNMTGGKLVINASDDGISVINDVTVTGDSKIYINKAYEGLEAKDIVFGTKDGNDNPYLYVYSNDDGINATEKYKVEYVYEDESEEKYARTTYSRTGGSLTVYNGELDISIADDKEQEYSLPVANGLGIVEDGSLVTGSFTASGDGIDCNGSMYAYGGKIVVFGGASSTGNSPIDCNDDYYIGEGAIVFAAGDMGMPENPTELKQAMIMFGGDNGMMGPPPEFDPSQGFPMPGEGFNPGEGFMPPPGGPGMRDPNEPSALGIEAGSFYKIVDSEGNVILTGISNKKINYLLLSSPEIKDGVTYTLIAGEVSTEFTATTVAPEGHGNPSMPPQ